VFAVPVSRLYRAFHEARLRRRWLGSVKLTVRSAAADKSMRLSWSDGSAVDVFFVAKGPAKGQQAAQHRKLTDHPSADRMKAWWADRLMALGPMLVSPRRT
jgi:uncharacterized protein YndB with AHSA1/START domain